jgi:hypothetical protein
MVGPTNSESFRDTAVDVFAEASKTAQTFVVELDSLEVLINDDLELREQPFGV